MANCKNGGASHRKRGGHVTPKLGTAERPRQRSVFTQVNFRCISRLGHSTEWPRYRTMTFVHDKALLIVDHVNTLKHKNFLWN